MMDLFDKKAVSIVNRYTNVHSPESLCFPDLTNQYVNRELKELATLAKIDKRLTYHSSRHTFATTLLNKGVRIEAVRALLGHKKLEQTQEYANLLPDSIINELKAVS